MLMSKQVDDEVKSHLYDSHNGKLKIKNSRSRNMRGELSLIKYKFRDFPGGPVDMNMPCIAGDKGLIRSKEPKVPYATEELSPHCN